MHSLGEISSGENKNIELKKRKGTEKLYIHTPSGRRWREKREQLAWKLCDREDWRCIQFWFYEKAACCPDAVLMVSVMHVLMDPMLHASSPSIIILIIIMNQCTSKLICVIIKNTMMRYILQQGLHAPNNKPYKTKFYN